MNPLFLLAVLIYYLSSLVSAGAHRDLPALLLVPGAFHPACVYDEVAGILHKIGYQHIEQIELRSVGHVLDRQRDIQPVKRVLNKHLNAGRDVVLVGNSYGSTVIGEAVQGFKTDPQMGPDLTRRGPHPIKGRVRGLVMLAGYIPPISEIKDPHSKPDIHTISPPFFRFTSDDKVWCDGDLAKFPPQKTFFNLLSPKEADYWTKKLRFSSFTALNATAKYIPYTGDFQCVYVVGTLDNTITPAFAQTYIAQKGAKFSKVEHQEWDHISMVSRPKEVASLIHKYAVDTRKW